MADDNEDRIGDQAIGWFALLRDEQVTAADRTAFERWLAQDPRHEAAWRDVQLLWSGLDGLAADPLGRADDNSYIDYPSRHAVPEMSLARATGVAMIGGSETLSQHQSAQEVTGIGEMRTIELADGSSIELDTASALSIHYTDTARRVVLHDGQGFFMVAKDATRPFTVEAAGGSARAVGTAFNVRIRERQAAVTVVEGRVEVAKDGRSVMLSDGQQVMFGTTGLGEIVEADLETANTWRLSELVFDQVPLSDVVRDIQRYREGWILLMDDEVARMPISGVYDMRDPEAALAAICATHQVKMRRLTDRLVVIESA